eukprot:122567_1
MANQTHSHNIQLVIEQEEKKAQNTQANSKLQSDTSNLQNDNYQAAQIDYAFNALNDETINEYKDQIIDYLTQNNMKKMNARQFKRHIAHHCSQKEQLNESLDGLYVSLQHHKRYEELRSKIDGRFKKTRLQYQFLENKMKDEQFKTKLGSFSTKDERANYLNNKMNEYVKINMQITQKTETSKEEEENKYANHPKQTSNQIQNENDNTKETIKCKYCNYCSNQTEFHTIKVTNRDISPGDISPSDISPTKITLQYQLMDDEKHKLKSKETKHNQTQEAINGHKYPEEQDQQLTIFASSCNIQPNEGDKFLKTGATLCKMDGLSVVDLKTVEVLDLIKLAPLPVTLTFSVNNNKFMSYMKSCCTGFECNKCDECITFLKDPTQQVLNWFIKFIGLSMGIVSKGSAINSQIMNTILLYKSSANGAMVFTMIMFISLISPYILSYSSGVQIFLYRKTFQDVKLFTFKSLLLFLFLFPTGILYFIFLDLIDALLEVYKWFAFGLTNKIKTKAELVQTEANAAQYFGMSRMDWFALKKQKSIAQLFFETIPQVLLQCLLFFGMIQGREISGITNLDLIKSITSALFSCVVQFCILKLESTAVKETVVEYGLHCITCKFGWVPLQNKFKIKKKKSWKDAPIKRWFRKYCCMNKYVSEEENVYYCMNKDVSKDGVLEYLDINYNIQYVMPIITSLTQYMKNKNDMESMKIGVDHNEIEVTYGSVEYDFSNIAINSLISTIKGLSGDSVISIRFGQSLRLLRVRSVISLLQACSAKNIKLPDIHQIDWNQAFKNTLHYDDPRLFSYTFDEDGRSLLISLYLTQDHSVDHYATLKSFISEYDVPINIQDDKGDTILHHMIQKNDYEGIYELLKALKPNQKFNFNAQNLDGDTVIHAMINKSNSCCDIYDELNELLSIIGLKSENELNLAVFNDKGQTPLHLALQNDVDNLQSEEWKQTDINQKTIIIQQLDVNEEKGKEEEQKDEHEKNIIHNVKSKMIIRKEIRSLSVEEQNRFFNAIDKMMEKK